MSAPFTLTISANVVAWYAAIVSTVDLLIQFGLFLRERLKVRVSFQSNMEMLNDPTRQGMTLPIVTVVNTGRRPVTITGVGLQYLEHKGAVFVDIVPQLPHELTEGKSLTALVDQSGLRFSDIRCFQAWDAAGRKFKFNVAPWYKRLWWFLRRVADRYFATSD